MIAKQSPEIRNAVDTLYELSANPDVRAQYEAREKAWRDRMAEIDWAYDDGIEKGLEKGLERGRAEGREAGRAEEREEIANKLKNMGLPPEQISAATGLPPETLE
jgi:predicted transposase/invertase (TIGR01784 family)